VIAGRVDALYGLLLTQWQLGCRVLEQSRRTISSRPEPQPYEECAYYIRISRGWEYEIVV
jgi:hypothetical protein